MTFYAGPIAGDSGLANQVFITTVQTSNFTAFNTATLTGGSNTASGAAVTAPSFSTGVAQQLSTTQDLMLYIEVKAAQSLAVAIGPTSTPANTVVSTITAALGLVTIRVPAGWWTSITSTIANLGITAVGC
jgi:hypothetical protein